MGGGSVGCPIPSPTPTPTGLIRPCCEAISVVSEILNYTLKDMASCVPAALRGLGPRHLSGGWGISVHRQSREKSRGAGEAPRCGVPRSRGCGESGLQSVQEVVWGWAAFPQDFAIRQGWLGVSGASGRLSPRGETGLGEAWRAWASGCQ